MKRLIIISLIFFVHNVFAQNLVPNPSFEDTIQCPSNPGINDTEYWESATSFGSPDYFHTCGTSSFGVPSNGTGFQNARTGNAYAGLITNDTVQDQLEYLEVELTQILIAEQCYKAIFYFSIGNYYFSNVLSRDIGLKFSNGSIFSTDTVLLYDSTNTILNINCIDTLNDQDWIEVSGEYIAFGGESNITIGVFYQNSTYSNSIYPVNGIAGYSYIDDVSVIPCPIDSTSENKWECINGICVDTVSNGSFNSLADCEANCEQVGIIEQKQTKQLLRIIDVLGREAKPQPHVPLFYIYDDGTVEKKIVIE